MAAALAERVEAMDREAAHLNALQAELTGALSALGVDFILNGAAERIPGNVSLSFAGAEGETLMHRLDLMGFAVATGSACNSRETVLSHVIAAMGLPERYARGTLRVSFGPENTPEEARALAKAVARCVMHNA